MPTIDCPGCGLPRAEAETDRPCPVCAAGVRDLPEPRVRSTAFPTDGLPSDISQLAHAKAETAHGHRPEIVVGVICLIAGIALAVAVQSLLPAAEQRSKIPPTSPPTAPTAAATDTPSAPASVPFLEIPAADDSEFHGIPIEATPELPAPKPADPPPQPAPPGRNRIVVHVELPEGNFVFPSSMWFQAGTHIVLTGHVRTLQIGGLVGGSVVDASKLVAQKVVINQVERSTVKVNAPNGEVVVSHPITDGSTVEIHAPGSEVNFRANANNRDPRINSGSHVKITAKKILMTTRVAGDNTRLEVTLDNGGSLKIPAVDDAAIVEYRKSDPGNGAPDVDIPQTGPHAKVRRIE